MSEPSFMARFGAQLVDNGYAPRVWLESVEVREHGANSAIYTQEQS